MVSKTTFVPRRRLFALLVVLVVAFAIIIGRLAMVQGVSASRYAAIGLSQRMHTIALTAERGSIFDRNGNELAISVPQSTIWADPKLVTDPAVEARTLAPVLNEDPAVVQDELSRTGDFVYVARRIDDATAAAVKALNLPGIFNVAEPKRFNPAGDVAAPVIGSVGTDNSGLAGLEVQYDKVLAGRAGKLTVEQDPSGKAIPGGQRQLQPAARGSDLVLTIDRSFQYETERDLANEIVAANARGGRAVVMDSRTGEILAMASLVAGANPGDPPVPAPSNEVLTDVYEPGSVNKLITLSAALEEGVVAPSDTFAVPDSVRVADQTFRDDVPHPANHWSVTDILTNSSNVGTINIAAKLGKDRLDRYLRKFGFGSRSALRFPGESAGLLLDPKKWYPTSIATVPIGQGVAGTAVQVLAAYNAVANGGMYIAPKLVRAVVDPSGKTVPTPASETHRVVSTRTATEMTAMLSEVVRVGTGTAASIDGYTVSGKTGTARKVIDGHYKDGAYFSSFAGFVPSEKPALTALVVLDEPTPIFGGLVAAPVFAQVARYGLRELQVAPPPAAPAMFDGVPHAGAGATVVVGEPGGDAAGVPGQAAPPILTTPTTAPTIPATTPTTAPTSPTTAPTTARTTSPTTTTLRPATPPAGKLGGPTTTSPPGKAASPVVSTPLPAGSVVAPSQAAAPAGGVPTTLVTARSQPSGPSP